MQDLFACTFHLSNLDLINEEHGPEIRESVKAIIAEVPELDVEIQAVAPERHLDAINKVDLAVLRLIMFESKHRETPKKVLINEGIELAKAFGSESSPKFVNGVLAKLLTLESSS